MNKSGRNCQKGIVRFLVCGLVAVLAACSAEPGNADTESTQDSSRQTVQSYSNDIRELLAIRPYDLSPDAKTQRLQDILDGPIAELEQARDPAYRSLVLAQRPDISAVAPGSRFFHVPVRDFDGGRHWMTGEIPAVWHLHELDPAVFTIAEHIRLHPANLELPDGARIKNDILLGGTALQSMAHAYPGDFDYNETFKVWASSHEEAGAIMADAIAEFVGRSVEQEQYEFVRLRVMPQRHRRDTGVDFTWNTERVLDLQQRAELARQLTTLEGGRINTDWRALAAKDRFFIIGKIFYFDALDAETDSALFSTEPIKGNYQAAYFGRDVSENHKQRPLGEHAQNMLDQVEQQSKRDHFLKAAKRAFNYCRVIGDLDCLDAVIPLFATQAAKAYHSHKVLEAIVEALNPEWPP